MENYKLVLPEHLNQYGYLFGGTLLMWVDEISWIAATSDFPACNFVTIAMDQVEFRRSVREGTILKFLVMKARVGKTSIQYRVEVFRNHPPEDNPSPIFSTGVTFVCLDPEGKKRSLPSAE